MRRHLSSETWEVVIRAIEELKTPLRPHRKELGIFSPRYSESKGSIRLEGLMAERGYREDKKRVRVRCIANGLWGY